MPRRGSDRAGAADGGRIVDADEGVAVLDIESSKTNAGQAASRGESVVTCAATRCGWQRRGS